MAELGYTDVTLPSHGVFYDGKVPGGVISIRKMTTREDSILLSQGARGLERMDKILKAITRLPNGFKHEDLLLTDRMAIMLAMRTITYGPIYTYRYKCSECGSSPEKATINIVEDLNEKTPESLLQAFEEADPPVGVEELVEPFDVHLKDADCDVSLRYLRGHDELSIAKKARVLKMQSNDPTDPSYLFRLQSMIERVNGEEKPAREKEAFVRNLSALDAAIIRIEVEKREPGIDLRVYPECSSCGSTNELIMPFTAEFFRPAAV